MFSLLSLLPVNLCLIPFRQLLFTGVLSFSFSFSIAQENTKQYQFRRIDITQGLSNDQVTTIFKDSKGFMWFGTWSGLNRYDGHGFKIFKHDAQDSSSIDDDYTARIWEAPDNKLLVRTRTWINIYDPLTEKFSHNVHTYFTGLSLPDTTLLNVVKTGHGDFYFLFAGKGLYRHNPLSRQTTKMNLPGSSHIKAFSQNTSGDIWLIYENGIFEKLHATTGQVVYRSSALSNHNHGELLEYTIMADSDDELWIYAISSSTGLFYFRPSLNELIPINKETDKLRLNTNLVKGLLQDNQQHIWVCTDHGGINIIDKKANTVQYVLNNDDDNTSISQNSITSVYQDDQGIVWIGTFKKGINCFHRSVIKFPLYKQQLSNPNSLSFNDVNRFAEDAKGNLWIGTNGGGLIYYDRHTNKFTTYKHQPANDNSISNDVIVSLCMDKQQKLWIGTYFGGLDCYDGKKFTHYRHDPANPASIADNRIYEIYEDLDNNLWIGTLDRGLDRLDRQKNIFYHYTANQDNSIRSDYISSITQNQKGDLWVGTGQGCDVLEKSSARFIHYGNNASDTSGLSHYNVNCVFVDSYNRHWIGTREGLNLFDNQKKSFQHFTVKDGLPDNSILSILEDDQHNLWISTPNGICNLKIRGSVNGKAKISCKTYDKADGLQGMAFNVNAALKTSRGELAFGGPNGFNLFLPQNISSVKQAPKIVFTGFQLFNKNISPGEEVDGKVLLPQTISETSTVTLNHNQNVIAIEFAALNFFDPEKIKYAYKLEGFKNEWLMADGRLRKAFFTNLDPGEYVFHVRTGNDDGSWNNNESRLRIIVRPPFWKSPLAYVLYFLMIAIVLYIARLMIIGKARERFAIEQERLEAQRMHELDLMKIKFFTNVSHEFRTPLSLIISPVEKFIKAGSSPDDKNQFRLILRNARRLLNLVNQLLDFRKMEEQELRVNKTAGDIISFIGETSYSFSDIAENKQIRFSFSASQNLLFTSFDHDKLERILFNLLSNAFKFTDVGGAVTVRVALDGVAEEQTIRIEVSDTGIGIEKNKQEAIFERFFQNEVPGNIVNQGSGIGLSITKEFVRLHGGTITVESEINKGSCFIVTLPVDPMHTETGTAEKQIEYKVVTEVQPMAEPDVSITSGAGIQAKDRKKTLLLVEDNDDFRFYIKDNLKAFYTISEATNGKTGWQKTLSEHPDLIVCDISMPEMNGIDLCRKIKSDGRTSFIPVILLTALVGEEQQLAGLQTGASDYVTKPFNFEILLSKIRNLLQQQESFKKTYQKQVQALPTEVEEESADQKFVQRALAIIEKNISNPDFSVEEMSREMFLSRGALYNKIFNLTGKSPIEFIRSIRLQRAAQLLQKNGMTVAEVAYQVGFNNPKYFSKYFKMEYNMLPSAYTEACKKSSKDEH